MTTRFLPPDEWHKLEGTPFGPLREQMSPETTQLLVVEDDLGVVVGTWAVVILPHLEGFWVHPDHQGKAGVAKNLLREMFRHLKAAGLPQILTHAPQSTVAGFLERLGAKPIQGSAYILPIEDF